MMMHYTFVICAVASLLDSAEPANILAFFPTTGRSHFKPFERFFMHLAHRGHNVTVVTVYPSKEQIHNYNEIQFEDKPFGTLSFAETRKQYRAENWIYMFNILLDLNTHILRQDRFRKLLESNDTKFDLIFMELYHMDVYFLLGDRFDCPIIGVNFQPMLAPYEWMVKNPTTFSYVPQLYSPYTDHMNFFQRFANAAFHLFTTSFYYAVSLPAYRQQAKSIWQSVHAEQVPAYEHNVERLSLILVETHFSAGNIRPNLPNVVEVGGIHIQDVKPLPKDIQEFMDTSENGVIFVSLGTLINPTNANDLGNKLLDALRKLPYRVIWKWKENLFSDSSNQIMIREWLPQLEILNHPKCKLFISHGGYHSLLETIYTGVPILGIPFFTDQHHNTAMIEKFGIGTKTSPETNEQDLEVIIRQLLTDDKYLRNCQYQSKLFKDRPISPIDTATYWTEYVMRYKGAPHLKSAATKLYWFQFWGLDVLLAYGILLVVLFYLMKIILLIFYLSLVALCLSKDKSKLKIS